MNESLPNFDRLAKPYRWMEFLAFGPFLWWCRCAYLADVRLCSRALVLGCGDGRFSARLLDENPTIHIDAVDASSAMLHALVQRAGPHAGRVRIQLADVREWQPPFPVVAPPYDVIVTHFFLDCLTTHEIQTLATRLRHDATPSALWLVSEFVVPSNWFGRLVARPIVWLLYLIFGQLTGLNLRSLPDHAPALRTAGFDLLKRRTWLGGLLASELWRAQPANQLLTPTPTPL